MKKADFLMAAASGILLAAIFPSLNLKEAGWICLVPLLAAAEGKTPRQGFFMGLAAGTVFHIGLIYWVTVSMTNFGGLPMPVSAVLLVLFSAFLGLFVAAPLWLSCLARTRLGGGFCLWLPAVWTASEYIKSWLLTGFPWDCLGYSQFSVLSIIQIADITGVYGISFLMVFVNCAVHAFLHHACVHRTLRLRELLAAAALLALTLVYGLGRLHAFAEPAGPSLKITVIQPSIPQILKWDPNYLDDTMEKFKRLTLDGAAGSPDLLLWPESATPFFFEDEAAYRKIVGELVQRTGAYLLLGSPSWELFLGQQRFFNSAFLISPQNKIKDKYNKVHLVPFGEYVPLKRFFPFIQKMVAGIGDFSPGRKIKNLNLPSGPFATLICYEIIFPNLARQFVNRGARFIVNITNDAWFGSTGAPHQHLAMAALRAAENKRAVARAANTGISAFISPTGAISRQTKLFTEAVLPDMIYLLDHKTFYTRYGDVFAIACTVLSAVVLAAACRNKVGR